MGGVTGLHPAIILLALSIWGSLLGIVGMIIALPMTTLMISYYKRFVVGDSSITADVGSDTPVDTSTLDEVHIECEE